MRRLGRGMRRCSGVAASLGDRSLRNVHHFVLIFLKLLSRELWAVSAVSAIF